MLEICDAWEPVLRRIGYLDNAAFAAVHLIIHFGARVSDVPKLSSINRHEELPVTFELPMEELRSADRERTRELFAHVTDVTLSHVARVYGLPDPIPHRTS